MAREASENLGPVVLKLEGAGGSDYTIPGTLSFNTTGSTVTVELRLTDDATATAGSTLTVGNGLTVTPGATTSYSFVIPASFSNATHSQNVYFALIVTTAGSPLCYMKGTLSLSWWASR